MRNRTISGLVILGLVAVIGVISVQFYLLKTSYTEEDKKFNQTVHIALLDVIKKLYDNDINRMPKVNPVRRVDSDYYVVDLNDQIDAQILEYYLRREFEKHGITTDFEYGIFDCNTDQMVYGRYVSVKQGQKQNIGQRYLPKYGDLTYYFGLRFPLKTGYLIGNLKVWLIFTGVLLVVLIFFVYAIFIVLQQKRYSELQHDFINNMTHEFKTPIASTRIALDYLINDSEIKDNQKLNKYCQMMLTQNQRLNHQVERILQISQTEKERFDLTKQETNLIEILENVADVFNLREERIIVRTQFDLAEAVVIADELHLTNILYSLVDNAIKYSVNNPEVNIKLSKTMNSYQLWITDNGIGIPKKYQKRVFQRFFRVPTGDVHNVKGFGLGLFYVKRVCEKHRWKIKLKSESNGGTIVIIQIPA